MVRFLVLYKQPTDVEAFDRHYRDIHVPLAKSLPELRSYTISRNTAVVRGADPYYLVAELDWDDMDALKRCFASPAGQQAAMDVDELAKICPVIDSLVYEVETLLQRPILTRQKIKFTHFERAVALPDAARQDRRGGPQRHTVAGPRWPGLVPTSGGSPRANSSSTSLSTSSGTRPPAVQSAQRMPMKLPMPV